MNLDKYQKKSTWRTRTKIGLTTMWRGFELVFACLCVFLGLIIGCDESLTVWQFLGCFTVKALLVLLGEKILYRTREVAVSWLIRIQ